MAKKKVANLVVDVLVEAGVERVYGVAGDSLNGITDIIRTGGRRQRVTGEATTTVPHCTSWWSATSSS
jgi:thiamine pyrophosphate-dependent acetolactate synthase large subunit-like protein